METKTNISKEYMYIKDELEFNTRYTCTYSLNFEYADKTFIKKRSHHFKKMRWNVDQKYYTSKMEKMHIYKSCHFNNYIETKAIKFNYPLIVEQVGIAVKCRYEHAFDV